MSYRRRSNYSWVSLAVVLLVIAISAYFQLQGAVQCAADGGEYVRNWANWPICIGGK